MTKIITRRRGGWCERSDYLLVGSPTRRRPELASLQGVRVLRSEIQHSSSSVSFEVIDKIKLFSHRVSNFVVERKDFIS